MSKIELSEKLHASLYSTDLKTQAETIDQFYSDLATFNDPLVSVTGIDHVKAQFRFLTWFSSITSVIKSVTTTHDTVLIDADVTFAIAFIPIKIRSLTKFTFNSHGKVIAHEDVWSIRDIIQSIPLMGYLYQFGVRMNGTVSSHVINRVGWLFEKKVNKIQ